VSATDTTTVLFTDVVDSTGLRASLGDDAADEVRRRHDALLAAAVRAHRGTIVKGLGDGWMATFASASDGVAAAVAVQQAICRHNRDASNPRLSVRVGLSTGDVVHEDGDCFGMPVIEASRLCAAAQGDQVLATEVVRLLARSRSPQAFAPVGELALKGLPEPVAAVAVLWEPPAPSVEAAPPLPELLETGARLPFVGRVEELAAVSAAWKRALSGDRQAVLLAGEPGIGKTRLARELAMQAHEQGAVVLYGRCEEDLGAPYQPFVEALDHFVTRSHPAGLSGRLGRYAGELSRLCPAVDALVPGLDPPLRSDAETERYRLFEAVASWLAVAAEPAGLLLVLDDLHWATRPTIVLLQHVLHASAHSRLLVTGTYRDTDLGRTHPLGGLLADLRRATGARRLALSGLDVDGVTRLVADAAGHELDDDGAAFARTLQEETEGNPFFVGEILRHLRETGAVVERDGRWVRHTSVADLGIPEGIRDVIGRRLDLLSGTANTALSTAAVVGREFDLALVAAIAQLDEDDVVTAFDEAVLARLVEETGVGRYRFAHALVRSTLYEELRATRRSRLHARVAHVLGELRPDDVAALAHHHVQAGGGNVDRAVEFSRRAGDDAMAQLAHDHAVHYYRQALELLEGHGNRALDRCAVAVSLGEAQRRTGDAAYRRTLLDAAERARQLGSVEHLVAAALTNTRGLWSMAGEVDAERIAVVEAALAALGDAECADRARLLGTLAVELMFTTEDERRQALSDEAVSVARRVGDAEALADVLMWAVPTNFVPWRSDVLLRSADELLALAASLDDPQRWGLANLWNFLAHAVTGDVETADGRLAVADRIADELGQPTLRWLVKTWTTFRLLRQGDLEEADRHLTLAFELGQRTGQPDAFTWYAGQLWILARERGELLPLFDVVQAEAASRPGLPAWQGVLGFMHCMRGELNEARAVLHRMTPGGELAVPRDVLWLCSAATSLELAEHVGDLSRVVPLYALLLPYRDLPVLGGVIYLGSAERYLACGARALGRLDDAVAHLDAAVALEERMRARTWLGVACADLARTLRSRGADGDAARADAAEARARELSRETGSVQIEHRLAGALA
jgi:class 3 adenylate cyclase/tetratricopeptide (TPR) repeat protein